MKRTSKRSRSPVANQRAQAIIELMLGELQRGLRDPHVRDDPEWSCMFGAKQSMVVNLQKLVQALAALPTEDNSAEAPNREGAALTKEEIEVLTAWLEEGKREKPEDESIAK